MTKQEAMPNVNWDAMPYATALELTLQDGRVWELSSFDYWPTKEVDLVCGGVEERQNGNRVTVGYREIPLPNPAVESIRILARGNVENHPSHPEHAYVFPTFKDVYTDTWTYKDFNLT